jgi:predicted nucleic acid-binding protein
LIYLDTSVALAHLLAEDRSPPQALWQESLISSRLIEYEIWTRIHARKLARSHGDEVRSLLGRGALIELSPPVLARALEPFPKPVRTLGALHLASIDFLQKQGQAVTLASYDDRLRSAARPCEFLCIGSTFTILTLTPRHF